MEVINWECGQQEEEVTWAGKGKDEEQECQCPFWRIICGIND